MGGLWWLLARMRLCLGGVDDGEIRRLLVRRVRWMVLFVGLAAGGVLVASTTASEAQAATSAAPPPPNLAAMRHQVEVAGYVAAGVLALVAAVIWGYAAVMVRRALRDRESMPEVCSGTAVRVVEAREGGWPLLMRRRDGRWLWLTGNPATLQPVLGRLARAGPGFRVTVTLQHYRRSRVVKEIRGMAVEALEAAWAVEPGLEPAGP
jgi:hypothetical protein